MSTDTPGDDDRSDLARNAARGRIPPGFDGWPIAQQADWVARRHTRLRLLEMVLANVGIEPDYANADGEKRQLSMRELARIVVKAADVAATPEDWAEWPPERQAAWLAERNARKRLVEMALDATGQEHDRQRSASRDDRLTKEELAIIHIRSGGVI